MNNPILFNQPCLFSSLNDIGQMAIPTAFPGFNDLGRSVAPIFLLMDEFLNLFSTFREKMRKCTIEFRSF